VYYADTPSGNRAVLSSGVCHVPVPGLRNRPPAFRNACKTHDLGYDLMRCFNSSGQHGDIRKAIDNVFFNDMKAVVSNQAWWSQPADAFVARVWYEAVSANSRAQDYGVP
jgi:Prokaryotic phospholipase A2